MPGKPLHLTDKYDKMSVEIKKSPRFFVVVREHPKPSPLGKVAERSEVG